jgi:hypothetical protein
MANDRTSYGSGRGTGSASIDEVVMDLPPDHEFGRKQVEDELRRRGLQSRGAVAEIIADSQEGKPPCPP